MTNLRLRAFVCLILLCAFFQTATAHAGKDQPRALEAPQLTAFSFSDRTGGVHRFAELKGHPAVVNFWATWCGPCREEMPRLQKLASAYQPQGVNFVAVSLDEAATQPRIEAALQKSGLKVPVWTGATPATLQQLGLGELVPSTLILDSDGEVVGKIEGEARDKDITARVDWLLHGRTGKQPKIVQKNDW